MWSLKKTPEQIRDDGHERPNSGPRRRQAPRRLLPRSVHSRICPVLERRGLGARDQPSRTDRRRIAAGASRVRVAVRARACSRVCVRAGDRTVHAFGGGDRAALLRRGAVLDAGGCDGRCG
jgi:hypothetical protein